MPDWLKAEGPQHEVEIMRPFYMGIHQVTVGAFHTIRGAQRLEAGGTIIP